MMKDCMAKFRDETLELEKRREAITRTEIA